MAFYTKGYLRNRSQQFSKAETERFILESKVANSFDIFLSHSYRDKEFIDGLFAELSEMGFTVYVDWIVDPELSRSNITNDTAETVRMRMKQSASLIYATSVNASKSKWMPWELGFMDGDKGKCAILPIMDYPNDTFKGQEFLSVYPYITKDELKSNSDKRKIRIHKSIHSYERLNEWI